MGGVDAGVAGDRLDPHLPRCCGHTVATQAQEGRDPSTSSPSRPPTTHDIRAAGDSILVHNGPSPSARRPWEITPGRRVGRLPRPVWGMFYKSAFRLVYSGQGILPAMAAQPGKSIPNNRRKILEWIEHAYEAPISSKGNGKLTVGVIYFMEGSGQATTASAQEFVNLSSSNHPAHTWRAAHDYASLETWQEGRRASSGIRPQLP